MAKPLYLYAKTESQATQLRAAWPGVEIQYPDPENWPKNLIYDNYFQDMLDKAQQYKLDLKIEFPGPETANEL